MDTNFDQQRTILDMLKIEEILKDPSKMAIAIVSLVGLLTLIVLFAWSKKLVLNKLNRKAVLILGPCNSGKTVLFSQLIHGKPIETFTSIDVNVGKYSFGKNDNDKNIGNKFPVYDIPGNHRLRYSALEKLKEEAKVIIFVIDASKLKQTLQDSTEYLYNVLIDSNLQNTNIPLLVVCNKQDLGALAKKAEIVKKELEKEMNILRETKSKPLLDDSGKATEYSEKYLGKKGKDFQFSDLKSEIKFLEASAKQDWNNVNSGISSITKWIAANL